MSGEQIEKLVSGNTTCGEHESKRFTSYSCNRPDGTFGGHNSEPGPSMGTWRVSGINMCRHPFFVSFLLFFGALIPPYF